MARKKDLGGLAALAGLAYMASRDKASKGADRDTDTGVDVQPSYGKASAATAPDLGEIRDEEGTLSKLRRNTETGEMYDPTGSSTSAPARPAASRAKPSAAPTASASKSTASASKPMGDDQYNPDVRLRTGPAPSRVGRAGQATVSNESMADKIAREAMMKRRAREAGVKTSSGLARPDSYYDSTEDMKKGGKVKKMASGGGVKGWGISRGARKAKNY
jgi:hypothetical protein